jgi:tetratricopeptide (TPR) repeat protein
MISTKLFPIFKKFVVPDQTELILHAFKQDPIIWQGLTSPQMLERVDRDWPGIDFELTPASLALFALDPSLLQNRITEINPSVELLENCMLTFENYLHEKEPVDTFEKAALLALALYKKYQQNNDWNRILRETVNQQNVESEDQWVDLWGSPFVILNGWLDDRLSFLQSQLQVKNQEFGLKMLRHIILSMPAGIEEKASVYKNALTTASIPTQVEAVQQLRSIGQNNLAKSLAQGLLERHVVKDFDMKATSELWQNSEKSLLTGNNYRQLAALAQMAGEYGTAEKLLKVAIHNYSAELAGAIIQNSGLQAEKGEPVEDLVCQIPQMSLSDEAVQNEIAMIDGLSEDESISKNSALADFLNADAIYKAGNETLAKQIAAESTNKMFVEKSTFTKKLESERAINWSPRRLLDLLIEFGLWNEARFVVDDLVKQNPVDLDLLHQSVAIAEGMSDRRNLIQSLENIILLEREEPQWIRQLANAYRGEADWENAYTGYGNLLEQFDSQDTQDMLGYAESALKLNKPAEANEFAQKVLENDPNNGTALAILGYAHHKQGETEKAIDYLNRSVSLAPDAIEPWLLMAELHKEKGDADKSIEVLKTARSTFPGERKIAMQLAKELLEQGQAATALEVLKEGQNNRIPDLDSSLLMIRAQKSLHLPETSDLIEQTYQTYPHNPEAIFEYAEMQLQNGERESARDLLKSIVDQENVPVEWKLVYVDAVLGEDYRNLHQMTLPAADEVSAARKLLSDSLLIEPENIYAKVLAAELAIKEGQTEKAFDFLSSLLKENSTENSSWFDRIKAGFAWAATLLKKFDLALGTIQSIIESHPQWTAARQTLAEVDKASGEISDAVDQANQVLELASDTAESAEWFVNFMSNLGKTDEAEKAIENLVKTQPNKIPLYEKLVEMKLARGADVEAKEVAEKIKHSLPKTKRDAEIVQAARLFNKLGDRSTALDALKMRINNPNVAHTVAFTDLAAFLRENDQFTETLSALADAEQRIGKQRWLDLLKAETLHANGDYQEAYELLKGISESNENRPEIKYLSFVSPDWQNLLGENPSTISLEQALAFESGNYEDVFQETGKSDNEPASTVVQIEASRALGTETDTANWLDATAADEVIYSDATLSAQVSELFLDAGKVQTAGEILMQALEKYPQDRLLKILAARQSALASDWPTAEALFVQEIPGFATDMKICSAKSVCTARNLAKTCADLDRWNEAVDWSKKLIEAQPANQSAKFTRLQTLVKGLEFVEENRDLSISKHILSDEKQEVSRNELTALLGNLDAEENSELIHWAARGKVVLEPSQSNIRKLALITPEADDIAAMMMALNRSDQYSTAMQLGKKHGSEPLVLFALAKCQAERDPQAALESLEKLWKGKTILPGSYALSAKLNQKQKVFYSAINQYEEALDYWPEEALWHELAADNWNAVGDYQNCTAHLEKANELTSDNSGIQLKLGKAYLQGKSTEKAIDQLQAVCKTDVNQYEAWEGLAEAYYQSGKADQALEAAQRASQVNEFSVKPHLLSAQINLDKGAAAKALEQAQKAVQQDENNAEGLLILAKAWLANGKKLQALQALERLPQAKGVSIQLLIEHAHLIKEINGAANAKGMLESLAERYPDNLDVLNMLAEAQLANGEKESAEKTAQQSLKLQEGQPKIQRFLGKLEFEGGHLDQAIYHYSKAIALEPQEIESYLELSKVYEKQRDHTSALNILNTAMSLDSKDMRIVMAAANLMRNAKDYRKAEEYLRRAVEIAPNDLNAKRQLGAVIALNLVESSQEASSHI